MIFTSKKAEQEDSEEQQDGQPHNNRIWVTEFNSESAARFTLQVLEEVEKDSAKPIVVFIDSYGGEVDALSTMISVMDSVPNPIVTVAMGKAMSCGAMLLAHGNVRCAAPHARIMIHEVTAGSHGNINDLLTDAKENDRVNKYWMEILAKDCGKDVNKFKELFRNDRRDIYLTPAEAVEFGLADKVGIPHVQPQMAVQYQIVFLEDRPRPTLESTEPAPVKATKAKKKAKKAKK